MRPPALAILAALALFGCATAGTKVDPQVVASFKPGVTTYAQVTTALGRPTSETVSADGQHFVAYSYVHSAARPESFIPIVGPLVGGADSQSSVYMFHFGPDLLLVGTTTNNSNVGVGTGLASGTR